MLFYKGRPVRIVARLGSQAPEGSTRHPQQLVRLRSLADQSPMYAFRCLLIGPIAEIVHSWNSAPEEAIQGRALRDAVHQASWPHPALTDRPDLRRVAARTPALSRA